MTELPSGTVTLLFTDIEGSTGLLHELGDRYAGVLAAHRATLRDAAARHRGIEVDTQGDSFLFAFARATDAVAAARQGRVLGVGLLAWTAALRGLEERAWLLWGAVADEDGIAPLGGWRRHRDTCEERIRAAVGRPFDPARVAASLSLEDAVALALAS